jgi:hypothetical protein
MIINNTKQVTMDTDKFFTILFTVLCLCFNAHSQRFDEKRLNDSLAKYDYFEGVVNDMIKVQKNSKCGFVNIKGEEIIPLRYSWDGSCCYENFCYMQIGQIGDSVTLFSKKGEVIKSDKIRRRNDFSRIISFQNKVGIVVDDKIKYLDANMYWVDEIGSYFIFKCDDEGNQYSLLYDYEGNEILKYDEIHFMLNRSLFSEYESLQPYSNQYFIVKKNNKYGVVDVKDRLIVPFKFDKNIITLSDNYLIYHNFNKSELSYELSFIVFSLSGDTLSSTEYDRCSTYKNYIFGWHDSDCDIICNNKLTDRFKFGKNLITKDSSHVTINTLSNESVLDYFYINGDLLIYETNGKCGVIHKNGKEIVPCNYFSISMLDNLIIAHKDPSFEPIVSLFDKKGNCIKDNLRYYPFTPNMNGCLFTSSTDKDNESYKNLHPMLKMGLGKPPKTYYIWNDKKAKLIEVKQVVGDKLSIDYCKVKSDDGTYRIIKVK